MLTSAASAVFFLFDFFFFALLLPPDLDVAPIWFFCFPFLLSSSLLSSTFSSANLDAWIDTAIYRNDEILSNF